MKEVTAQELKELDPKRFEKEYHKWQEYSADYDWAEWVKEDYESQMKCEGIKVDNFYWDIGYSQSDGADFDGHVVMHEWMEANPQYAEQYPALYLACKQDGSYIAVRTAPRGHYLHFKFNESWWGTDPCGIFRGLDKDTWVELVDEQAGAANLEYEIKSTCERFMSAMYRTLRDEYEDITSEEAFIGSCECNEITFNLKTSEVDDEIYC
jgi:hypothetical protein